ncbi:unnamed protein product [Phytomonas sp. EM1]|nr:unnamed protein product [Phytomonas sp. EM1]|eukprot:CCW63398.1 unnamed protein product [Phytomonas sp. isolate EM1]
MPRSTRFAIRKVRDRPHVGGSPPSETAQLQDPHAPPPPPDPQLETEPWEANSDPSVSLSSSSSDRDPRTRSTTQSQGRENDGGSLRGSSSVSPRFASSSTLPPSPSPPLFSVSFSSSLPLDEGRGRGGVALSHLTRLRGEVAAVRRGVATLRGRTERLLAGFDTALREALEEVKRHTTLNDNSKNQNQNDGNDDDPDNSRGEGWFDKICPYRVATTASEEAAWGSAVDLAEPRWVRRRLADAAFQIALLKNALREARDDAGRRIRHLKDAFAERELALREEIQRLREERGLGDDEEAREGGRRCSWAKNPHVRGWDSPSHNSRR